MIGLWMKWFFGAVLLLLMAIAFQLELLAYAMYALIAVMVLSRGFAQSWIRHLSAERQCNQLTAQVGERVNVIVKVRNSGRLPIPWVLLEDLLPRNALKHDPPSLALTGQRMKLAMIRAGKQHTVLYQLMCNRRGYYQLGPLVLETGDLFGLHRRWRVASAPHFLMVYPRVVKLDGYDLASRRPSGEVRMSYRLYEDPTRIAGVRQYQSGDPLNRVHWRSTARTGVLHSKVYEPSTVSGATLLLDFHRASYDIANEPVRSDLVVTAAASIANAVVEMGQQVGLVTNGRDAVDRIRSEGWDYDHRTREAARVAATMNDQNDRLQPLIVPTTRGPEQMQRILEVLARVELTDGLDMLELLAATNGRIPRDATVIALLRRVTPSTAIALGSLQQQGYAVSAMINVHEVDEFASASCALMAQGIETHHLGDEEAVARICRRYVLR